MLKYRHTIRANRVECCFASSWGDSAGRGDCTHLMYPTVILRMAIEGGDG